MSLLKSERFRKLKRKQSISKRWANASFLLLFIILLNNFDKYCLFVGAKDILLLNTCK